MTCSLFSNGSFTWMWFRQYFVNMSDKNIVLRYYILGAWLPWATWAEWSDCSGGVYGGIGTRTKSRWRNRFTRQKSLYTKVLDATTEQTILKHKSEEKVEDCMMPESPGKSKSCVTL